METKTNSRNLRENLKFYFDKAGQEPVAINRGQERFVLLSESDFLKMQQEIFNLQRSLISSLQIQNGEGVEETVQEDFENDPLLKEYVAKYERMKKKTKAG